MASQAERRAKTRRQIIDAAKHLFGQHGFEAVAVAQIAKAANVAKGTFYQYYETKVDVLADVVRDEGEGRFKEALAKVKQGMSALQMLDRFLQVQCQWFEAHEKVAEALIMSALKTVGDKELPEKQRYSRHFQIELMRQGQEQGEIRDDVDAEEMAKVISGAMVLSVLAWCKNPQPNTLYPAMQQSLTIFLEGVRAKQETKDA
ncbi:TetR/AcrR family transcriptional regulator [Pseudomonadota bacterium]